jgi:predicted MPP superfamily phosphohydrolase
VTFAYNLLGLFAVFLSMLWMCEAVLFVAIVAFCALEKPFPARKTWARAKLGVALCLSVIVGALSIDTAYNSPVVNSLALPISSLPSCLDGFTIAMVSDVHVGPMVGKTEASRLVAQVNALQANAVVLVGDFTDGPVDDIGDAVSPFGELVASQGVYFVTGNHENLGGGNPDDWVFFMQSLGITTLENRRVAVSSVADPTCTFDLAGITDYSIGSDLGAALEGQDQTRPSVLLAHQPREEVVEEASKDYSVDLMLSGHTHGGQTWPIHVGSYILFPNSFTGLYKRYDGMWLFVSEGAFGWGPRVRFGSTNEINALTLRIDGNPQPSTAPRPAVQLAEFGITLLVVTVVCAFFLLCLPKGCYAFCKVASLVYRIKSTYADHKQNQKTETPHTEMV